MRDDELMDGLLRESLKAEVPRLSRGFDEKVSRRVRSPKLDMRGRVVMTVYGAASIAAAVWMMRDVPVELIGLSLAGAGAAAAGVTAYVRALTQNRAA